MTILYICKEMHYMLYSNILVTWIGVLKIYFNMEDKKIKKNFKRKKNKEK